METVPYKGMWGGMVQNQWSETEALLKAFMNYARNSDTDPQCSVILNCAPHEGEWRWNLDLQHMGPGDGTQTPLLREFMTIRSIKDETSNLNLSAQTIGLTRLTPRGLRNSYSVMTSQLDAQVLHFFVDAWVAEMSPIVPDMSGFRATFNLQIITPGMRRGMAKYGGSILGLERSHEPLIIYNPTPRWLEMEQDEAIYTAVNNVLRKTKEEAKRLGKDSDYLYLNYASHFQEPLSSYGHESQAIMRRVADQYDPLGIFQRLQPGSHKLTGTLADQYQA
jgi:hypothetical protein